MAARILTLLNKWQNIPLNRFGSVIFTQADHFEELILLEHVCSRTKELESDFIRRWEVIQTKQPIQEMRKFTEDIKSLQTILSKFPGLNQRQKPV